MTSFGTFLDGTNLMNQRELKWTLMFNPSFFLFRKVAFVFSVLYMGDYLWAQLLLQTCLSMTMLFYIWHCRALVSRFSEIMETFNEICTILLTYFLLCFTDFVPSAEARSSIGVGYISLVIINISVHLTFVLWASLVSVRLLIIKCCSKCKYGKDCVKKLCCLKRIEEVKKVEAKEEPDQDNISQTLKKTTS